MFLGSKSTDSILDIFQIGVKEVIRHDGLPEELSFKATHCEMNARGADLAKRIDVMRITFPLGEGLDQAQIDERVDAMRIGARARVGEDGMCVLALPAFEWRHFPRLAVVSEFVENAAAASVKSLSWEVKVKSYVQQGFNINQIIELMKERDASDLHIRAGSPPYIRIDNDIVPLEEMAAVTAADMEEIVVQLGSIEEFERLRAEREASWQYHLVGVGYLRVSGLYKQGSVALAIRMIPEEPVPFDQLNIPMVVRNIADSRRGLFLVSGVTGSGKSTTLASMIDYINESRFTHVITIEDPIEFVYRDKKSIISQRQIGRDTFSFANALRGALREDPDVILVGEMRDMETIRAAVSAAETGHLVFSTLHTMTAVDTVNRVISYFPQSERDLIRQELAFSLRGVVCQRLLKKIGGGRVPCVEVLLAGKPIVRDAILEAELDKLHSIIEVDSDMMSFDQNAVKLYQDGIVTKEEAVSACSNEEGFERIISGIKSSEGRKLLK